METFFLSVNRYIGVYNTKYHILYSGQLEVYAMWTLEIPTPMRTISHAGYRGYRTDDINTH